MTLDRAARALRDRGMPSVARGLAATMPIVLAGTMAVTTLNLGPSPLAQRARTASARTSRTRSADIRMTVASDVQQGAATNAPLVTASVVPATHVVRPGDTVSEIATGYGLSTASVLALNGLSWKSLIFPGQILRLTSARVASAGAAATPAMDSAAEHTHGAASATTTRKYTILRGDTVTSIARRFGVTVAEILETNHLVASSIIYAGRTLVIPRGSASNGSAASTPNSAPVSTQPAEVGIATVPLSPSMAANARVIISVGRSLGVPSYGIVIALATAAQESSLENLDYGDRDSVGLFQQRPSMGWGTVAQLTNPAHASELFYGGPKNPNRGRTRGLLDIPGWQELPLTRAAQAVQVSAEPNAYAKWEASARAWLAELG